MTRRRHEFTAEGTAELLEALDARLRERGVAGSIFVVGGAAIAANRTRRERVTEDVDALTRDAAVLEEAKALARERGLPENWLNPNAGMWMPPLPGGVLDRPADPGLRVTYADDGFLLATKLIAQRAKDADDVVALAGRLGLEAASPEDLEAHIRSYYTDPATLESTETMSTVRSGCSPRTPPGCSGAPRPRTPARSGRSTAEPSGYGAAPTSSSVRRRPRANPATGPHTTAEQRSLDRRHWALWPPLPYRQDRFAIAGEPLQPRAGGRSS